MQIAQHTIHVHGHDLLDHSSTASFAATLTS